MRQTIFATDTRWKYVTIRCGCTRWLDISEGTIFGSRVLHLMIGYNMIICIKYISMSQNLLKSQGKSRHFPSVPDLLDNLFDLMRVIEVSSLHKSRLYKHFLKCADFAVNFINSNDFY